MWALVIGGEEHVRGVAQGKPSPGDQGAERPPKTSTRVQASGRASPVEKKKAPRVPVDPGDEMDGLFVDPAPDASKKSSKASRAADRRRERGEAPAPAGVPDTRKSLPKRDERGAEPMSELNPKVFARATLTCTRGPEEGLSLNLIEGSYTIGRARENSFVLKDIAASRRHLRIDVDSRGARVVDMGSGNGTRVNGKRVAEHELKHGDRIEIGGSVLTYLETGKGPAQAAPEPVDDAQERVIRAAEKLAAELSGRMRFGDESQSGFEDGHVAKTQAIPQASKERINAELRRQKEQQAQQPASSSQQLAAPPPSQVRNEKLWNETFSNVPLDKVVPADEPLRGAPRAAEALSISMAPQAMQASAQVPQVAQRAALPRPAPLPLPPPPDEFEPSGSVGRGGSFVLSLLVTAAIVIAIGGGLFAVWFVMQNRGNKGVAEETQQEFAHAMERCQEAFKAGDWLRAYDYATMALQLQPGDPMATMYQRDARERIDAATRAPAPVPAPAPAAPPPAPQADAASPAPSPLVDGAPTPAPAPAPPPAAVATTTPAPAPVAAQPPPAPAPPPKAVKPAPPPREVVAAPKPKPPAPKPKPSGRGMSEDAAQAKFEDAVDALRSKDDKKGCRMLEEIADKAPPGSRWKEKAESLYSRRCDE
jgi:pSer/pThr/pTyr-binding forkhead associated (FHA) protein